MTLILDRVDDHGCVHKRSQRRPGRRAQGRELQPRRAVEIPPVLASEPVLAADLLPGHAIFGRWRAFAPIALYACQEFPLGIGVAPGVCLEPPVPDGPNQRCEVAVLASL